MSANQKNPFLSSTLIGSALVAVAVASHSAPALGQANNAPVIFENVRIFDGRSDALSEPSNVLVKDGKIAEISTDALTTEDGTEIDGEGKVLMPGLIDAHWHTMLIAVTPATGLSDLGYTNLAAGAEATAALMRGFYHSARLGKGKLWSQEGHR